MPLSKGSEGGGTDDSRSQTYCSLCYADGTFRHAGVSVEEFQALRRGFGAKVYATDHGMGFYPRHPETLALGFVNRAIPPPLDTPLAVGRCRQGDGRPKRYRRG